MVETTKNRDCRSRLFLAGRFLAAVVGVVFLIAGLMKATDLGLFARHIEAYGIVKNPTFVTVIAWGLIPLECGLGAALLVWYRPRLTLALATALLVTFIAVTSWASLTGTTNDCGCFGPWMKQTPGMESVQNLVLLAMVLGAWWMRSPATERSSRRQALAVTAACAAGLVVSLGSGVIVHQGSPVAENAAKGLFDQVDVYGHGLEYIDFGIGDNLVALIGTDCAHCRESVPQLNALAEAPDLPEVIALCADDEGQCLQFVEQFLPVFPIGHIDDDTFWRLLGDGNLPRVFLVRNGEAVHTWEESVPDSAAVKSVLISLQAGPSWADSSQSDEMSARWQSEGGRRSRNG